MKAVNLWKTLFCAALAVTAFSACSDDDKDDDGGMPSITVNGEASVTVAVKLDGDRRQGQDDADFYGRQVGGCRKHRQPAGYC